MLLAKVFVSFLIFVLSTVLFTLWNKRKLIHEKLNQLETLADHARDDAMFELTALRARLSRIGDANLKSNRLDQSDQSDSPKLSKINSEIIKHASSVIMMVVQKEKSLIQWGWLAFKVGRNIFRRFENSKKI